MTFSSSPPSLFPNTETWDRPSSAISSRCALRVYHTGPIKNAKAVIQINHGLAEHALRYARFANALSDAGYLVYAHDHRGHGHSVYGDNKSTPDQQRGVFAAKQFHKRSGKNQDGWHLVLDDIGFVNQTIKQRHPDLPVILFGHSMGAVLSYHYALKWPQSIDGLAVWNTAIQNASDLKMLKIVLWLEGVFKGGHKPSMVSKLTFDAFNKKLAPNQTSVDWLSKDVDECRRYEGDPLCGWAPSVSMWKGLASGIEYGASDGGLENFDKNMPVHLLAGDDDPSAGFGKPMLDLHNRMKQSGLLNTQCIIRQGGRHEALNEPQSERRAVTQGFIDWLDRNFA